MQATSIQAGESKSAYERRHAVAQLTESNIIFAIHTFWAQVQMLIPKRLQSLCGFGEVSSRYVTSWVP